MKNVLVTGGSGYVGRNLIHTLLKRYPEVTITSVSRSEGGISSLLMKVPNQRLRIVMADIRDISVMRCAMQGVDTVIHLAAIKRVDLAEKECRQAVTTNVIGTMNMLDAFEGNTYIQMSTDKAVEPCNCYGATKMVAEKLVLEKSARATSSRYMIVRSGNILESTGSVLEIWKHQIEANNEITVTNPDMMRFYTSVEGVVRLFIAVLEHGTNGNIYFTPHGRAVILKEIINEAIRLYGRPDTRVRLIGLRPGERMEERMRAVDEPNVIAGFEEKVESNVL
jgi:UDP-N-acetylglucosamine 4,6-dehydratase/5-epimerase